MDCSMLIRILVKEIETAVNEENNGPANGFLVSMYYGIRNGVRVMKTFQNDLVMTSIHSNKPTKSDRSSIEYIVRRTAMLMLDVEKLDIQREPVLFEKKFGSNWILTCVSFEGWLDYDLSSFGLKLNEIVRPEEENPYKNKQEEKNG